MSKLVFAERAWEEYLYWQESDKKTLRRVNLLLPDMPATEIMESASRKRSVIVTAGADALMMSTGLSISLKLMVLLKFCNVKAIMMIDDKM